MYDHTRSRAQIALISGSSVAATPGATVGLTVAEAFTVGDAVAAASVAVARAWAIAAGVTAMVGGGIQVAGGLMASSRSHPDSIMTSSIRGRMLRIAFTRDLLDGRVGVRCRTRRHHYSDPCAVRKTACCACYRYT